MCYRAQMELPAIVIPTRGYYDNGKRGSLDGAPIWRPVWWGQLGNDAEYREATKPRTAFKSAYYEGGHGMTIDGIPIRVAAHVKGWKACNKAALCKGTAKGRWLDGNWTNSAVASDLFAGWDETLKEAAE